MTGTNERLGLPRQDKMEKLIFCFDVDGTLVSNEPADVFEEKRAFGVPYKRDVPHRDIVLLLVILQKCFKNIRVCVWSGGGKQYAEMWGNRLELDKYVWRYASKHERADIAKHGRIVAIDDIQDTALGEINMIVRMK